MSNCGTNPRDRSAGRNSQDIGSRSSRLRGLAFQLANSVNLHDFPAYCVALLLTHVEHRRVNCYDITIQPHSHLLACLSTDELPVLLETVNTLVLRLQTLEFLVDLTNDPVEPQPYAAGAPFRVGPEVDL